jgi:hypothetical protein
VQAHYCVTCGAQHAPSDGPPDRCAVCEDARQYVPEEGQRWTTLDELRREHRSRIEPEGSGITGIGMEPSFAIGQRALHVRSAGGGFIWDCTSLVDDAVVARVRGLGGARGLAISHPHFYGAMIE